MNRTLLLKAVEFARQAVAAKTSLPILECLHLKGDGKRLTVTGANGDFYARMEVESNLRMDCCARAGRLKTILSTFTADDVIITQHGDTIAVCGDGTASIDILPGGDFPPMPEVKGKRFPIPSAAIAQVIPAAATDEARWILCSVYFDPEGFVVSADGNRFHAVKFKTPKEPMVIPILIAKALAEQEGEMRTAEGRFVATGDGWELGGKLIEGAFPRYQAGRVTDKRELRAVNGEFTKAVERAMTCAEDGDSGLDFAPDAISGKGYREPLDTGFVPFRMRPSYLLAALKAAGEGAKMSVAHEAPVIVENGDFYAAIASMRLIK